MVGWVCQQKYHDSGWKHLYYDNPCVIYINVTLSWAQTFQVQSAPALRGYLNWKRKRDVRIFHLPTHTPSPSDMWRFSGPFARAGEESLLSCLWSPLSSPHAFVLVGIRTIHHSWNLSLGWFDSFSVYWNIHWALKYMVKKSCTTRS